MTALSSLFVSGCITTKPSATDPVNTANYLFNTLETRVETALDPLVDAFNKTMDGLDFVRTDIESNEGERVLTYRGDNDIGVVVKLKAFPDYTNIKIRYGLTGHEHQSRRILEQTIGNL